MTTAPTEAIVVLVTTRPDDAERLAQALVESRLVACVNILPGVTSLYRWEGEVQRDEEVLLLLKTVADRFDAVADLVQRLHPYEVPEVIAIPLVAGSSDYLAWIAESVDERP